MKYLNFVDKDIDIYIDIYNIAMINKKKYNIKLENRENNKLAKNILAENIRIKNTVDSRFDDPEFVNQLLAELPGEIIHKSDTLNIEKMSKIQTAEEIISAGATVTLCGAVLVVTYYNTT